MRRTILVVMWMMALSACSSTSAHIEEGGAEPSQKSAGPQLILATADTIAAAIDEPGAELVLVNFWASWCAPCLEEFPAMLKVADRYRDRGLRVILISVDDEYDAARAFLGVQGVTFSTYFMNEDAHQFVMEIPWRGALPSTIIYNADGPQISFEGAATEAIFDAMLQEVLAL